MRKCHLDQIARNKSEIGCCRLLLLDGSGAIDQLQLSGGCGDV